MGMRVRYLAEHAVPVAPAIATVTGEQIVTLQAPEGVRYAVVTTYVPGQHLRRLPSEEATRRYGQIIASIHLLADRETGHDMKHLRMAGQMGIAQDHRHLAAANNRPVAPEYT